MDLSQTRG